MSMSIHKIPDLKRCQNEKEFFLWVEARLKKRADDNIILYFPTVNCYHTEAYNENDMKMIAETKTLAKRYRELQDEVKGC